jgi:hypothetical protein
MTPAQQTAHDIAILVAGIDSKLNELEALLPPQCWLRIESAHLALTRVLAETKAAVEVQK